MRLSALPAASDRPDSLNDDRGRQVEPPVTRTSPVGQPPIAPLASASLGPAARRIAPSTPPLLARAALAALTIASTQAW